MDFSARCLGSFRLLLFSIPGLAIGGAPVLLTAFLPSFYAQRFGLGLGLIGTIFMVSRIWNIMTDPVIGMLSDRTRSRIGRRKPWIAVGGLIFTVSAFELFLPRYNVGGFYLSLLLLTFYIGFAMISTPLFAWSGELETEYNGKSRVQAFMAWAVSAGAFFILLGPSVQESVGFNSIAGRVGIMGLFLILVIAVGVPMVLTQFSERSLPIVRKRASIGETLRFVFSDPLIMRVMASDFSVNLGQGIRTTLVIFFFQDYMQLTRISDLLLIQVTFGLFAAPLWLRLSYRLGKHRTVIAGEFAQATINLSMLAVTRGHVAFLLVLMALHGLAQGSGNMMLRAMVSDVADLHRLQTGEERSGLLFSIFNVTANGAAALSIGLALHLVAWSGFVPGGSNSPAALDALLILFAAGPALGHVISALLVWGFPLDLQKHAAVTRALGEQPIAAVVPEASQFPDASHITRTAGG